MSSSAKTAQTIDFKFCKYVSNRMLNKSGPAFFLTLSHSFFIETIRRVLKAYFTWKQIKADYSKYIQKVENGEQDFVLARFSLGAHKVGKNS